MVEELASASDWLLAAILAWSPVGRCLSAEASAKADPRRPRHSPRTSPQSFIKMHRVPSADDVRADVTPDLRRGPSVGPRHQAARLRRGDAAMARGQAPGVFKNDPRLAQKDIDTIAAWVDGGAPLGDDKDMPHGADSTRTGLDDRQARRRVRRCRRSTTFRRTVSCRTVHPRFRQTSPKTSGSRRSRFRPSNRAYRASHRRLRAAGRQRR